MDQHITIPAVTPRIQYLGDGTQTAFPYPFPVFAEADLAVYVDAGRQSGGYRVAGAGNSAGGTVTFDVPPSSGQRVTLIRDLPIERVTDFYDGGDFRAATLNDALDYLTASVQQVDQGLAGALRYDPIDPPVAATLPLRDQRADKLLAFDSTGAPTVIAKDQATDLPDYLAAGTGAVGREILDRLADRVSVRDFGAVGDGLADDTAAFQAALGAHASVVVPDGLYRITSTIALDAHQSLIGPGGGAVLDARGQAITVVHLRGDYARLSGLRVLGGETGLLLRAGPDRPCVANLVTDMIFDGPGVGLLFFGGYAPLRPCYWNYVERVVIIRMGDTGVRLARSGAGDTPNANRFRAVRAYSLEIATSGYGFDVAEGKYLNTFIDCEANLATTALACFRLGPGSLKTILVNPLAETLAAVPNVLLEAGSQNSAIYNLGAYSAGAAIDDQSGGSYMAVNAGYPTANRLGETHIAALTADQADLGALTHATRFNQDAGTYSPDMAARFHFVSAYVGARDVLLPAPGTANGAMVTIKKTDISTNALSVKEDGGPGPDNGTVVLAQQHDCVTVVSNGASWFIIARHGL